MLFRSGNHAAVPLDISDSIPDDIPAPDLGRVEHPRPSNDGGSKTGIIVGVLVLLLIAGGAGWYFTMGPGAAPADPGVGKVDAKDPKKGETPKKDPKADTPTGADNNANSNVAAGTNGADAGETNSGAKAAGTNGTNAAGAPDGENGSGSDAVKTDPPKTDPPKKDPPKKDPPKKDPQIGRAHV